MVFRSHHTLLLTAVVCSWLAGCGQSPRRLCSSHDDCLPCERCKDGSCIFDEGLLNPCGECLPTPEEICGDDEDNDCDGDTDEGCAGPCDGVVCKSPPGPCYAPTGTCHSGVCDYAPLADGTACDDGDSCTAGDRCGGGVCSGSPVGCDSPPDNHCIDDGTLRSYTNNGTCRSGTCSYGYRDVDCTRGCENGACRGDACAGVECNHPPSGCYLSIGVCRNGACHYGFLDGASCDDGDSCTVDDSCNSGVCTGTAAICSDPPPNECLDAGTMRAYTANGICVDGVCTYGYQDVICTNGCEGGLCNGDPCAGVTCDSPPNDCHKDTGVCEAGVCHYGYLDGAACIDGDPCTLNDTCTGGTCAGTSMICDSPPPDECLDAGRLRSFSGNGSCADGACEYQHQDITCTFGCLDGFCEGDPCAGVECNNPPGGCYQNTGICENGVCHYGYRNGSPCDDGDPCTVDDACTNGTCAGTSMICNSPPPDECIDASTLRAYSSNGECLDSACEYPHQDTTCVFSCSNGSCGNDPCAGVVCDNPPDECHVSPGTCIGGDCDYPQITECWHGDGCCPAGCTGFDDIDCTCYPCPGGLCGWDIQVVDEDGDVGKFSSLALDAAGRPHISYFDYDNEDLKYAHWNGSEWDIKTVDTAGDVGLWTTLALDASGRPRICYYDFTNEDVKLASRGGSSWDIQVVNPDSEEGNFPSMALDGNSDPHICYSDSFSNHTLSYARWNGNSWDTQTVDRDVTPIYYPSLAVDADGKAHIAYRDDPGGGDCSIKYAHWNGSDWDIQVLHVESYGCGHPSLALDAGGNPHICYYKYSGSALKYAFWDGNEWDVKTVQNESVRDTSLALDDAGTPHIVYISDGDYRLKYARWNGSDWDIMSMDKNEDVISVSMALDADGNPHISYYGWGGVLKYARWTVVSTLYY